ncbi:MAG: terminase gpA endonuclease subunit [Phycisphaerales bacterium]
MSSDVRRLRAGQLCRLLNSTPLGECLGERQLHRHRIRAGLRLGADGDPNRIDLLRYVGWLFDRRHAPEVDGQPGDPGGYEAVRERARLRAALLSTSGRDIGDLPEIREPSRRQAASRDFRRFCETYFARTFSLAWSPDHLKVIAKIETCVLEGGLFAMAMPRGSGKTSLCEIACVWAMLYGHREFVALVGSDEDHAANMLDSIRAEIEHNELLLEDFPEACFPIRALEGIHQRAAGQLHKGRQTHIGWTAKELVLPSIAGAPCSGAVIRVAGITGRIRGMKHKRTDGASVRPSLVLVDDPQTDESARSPSQCAARERVIAGAILGLAGPGRKIAGLMTLTVVRADDLADRLLDPKRHPQWQGERTRMLYSPPTEEALWDEYARIRADGLRAGSGLRDATAFYLRHRERMDAGAAVAWEERFNPDEASALQHAMNLRLQDAAAFRAEYQNDPMPEGEADAGEITAVAIAERAAGTRRGIVPAETDRVTAFVDVQQKALYWMVVAWDGGFGGTVVDYGTEPEQKEEWFQLRDLRWTLAAAAPRAGLEAAIRAGLDRIAERLLGREWACEDGSATRISRCLVDANWGQSTDLVYAFCRRSTHAALLTPSHGRYVGAASTPFSEYGRREGERVGLNWRMPAAGHRAIRHAVFDTNWWKSFVHARLAVPAGDPGSLVLFGRRPDAHRLLAAHLTSEYRVRTHGRGRIVDEWRLRPDGGDNHWLDCLVGAAVGASIEGVALAGFERRRKGPKVRRSLLELQRRKRAERDG